MSWKRATLSLCSMTIPSQARANKRSQRASTWVTSRATMLTGSATLPLRAQWLSNRLDTTTTGKTSNTLVSRIPDIRMALVLSRPASWTHTPSSSNSSSNNNNSLRCLLPSRPASTTPTRSSSSISSSRQLLLTLVLNPAATTPSAGLRAHRRLL